jgi:hypothetical protein
MQQAVTVFDGVGPSSMTYGGSTFTFTGPGELNGGIYVIDDPSVGNLNTIAFFGGVQPDENHFHCEP